MHKTAQQEIRELFNSTVNDQRLVDDFNLFDSSVSQKLWSTDYYCRELVNLDINAFLRYPPATDTLSSGAVPTEYPLIDVIWYCRTLNRLLDGFFMNSMSALDTLAHELFTLYDCPTVPRDKYIMTAKKMLYDFHPTSKTRKLLDKQLGQDWFTEFEPFRHCTTHESLIRHTDIAHSFDDVNTRHYLLREIILPDNPQARPFTYDMNRVASGYCQSTFKNIQSLISEVYNSVLFDIHKNGNVLPIPTT